MLDEFYCDFLYLENTLEYFHLAFHVLWTLARLNLSKINLSNYRQHATQYTRNLRTVYEQNRTKFKSIDNNRHRCYTALTLQLKANTALDSI